MSKISPSHHLAAGGLALPARHASRIRHVAGGFRDSSAGAKTRPIERPAVGWQDETVPPSFSGRPANAPHSGPIEAGHPPRQPAGAGPWQAIGVCCFLVVAVFAVFGRTLSYDFSSYDDSLFVSGQPQVTAGLSWQGLVWAFAEGPLGERYPLAMLSHMLDCQLYGLWPAGHRLTNLLLHAASAVVLFLVLWRMTARLWPSAVVAAVFAIHPLHVESVVWIAERRDVLSGLFFMLTLLAYDAYARRPQSPGRYLAVVGMFMLGLLAKPMLVTLPPLLLLLDYWPLGRFAGAQPEPASANPRPAMSAAWLILEKLPLVALALAAAGVTVMTHAKFPDPVTMPERLVNAAISYVAYVGQSLVPVGLSPYYSHPEGGWPAWQVVAALGLLLTISAAVVAWRRTIPYCFVGWFWYVGMLVPVLGLASVGGHSRADRYTYLAQIGLTIALVWSVARLTANWPARRWLLAVGTATMLAALMAGAWRQTGCWRDPAALWQQALACDPTNVLAHYSLGLALQQADPAGAAAQFRQALEMGPDQRRIYIMVRAKAEYELGKLAERKGDTDEAMADYRAARDAYGDYVLAQMDLARLLAGQGKVDEALDHMRRSSQLQPENADIPNSMATMLAQNGRPAEAIASFEQVLRLDPNSHYAHANLARLLAASGQVDAAIGHLRRAIQIVPDISAPYYQLAQLLRQQGKTIEAARSEQDGRKADRRRAEALTKMGIELVEQGKSDVALAQFTAAIAAAADYAPAHLHLAGSGCRGPFGPGHRRISPGPGDRPQLATGQRGAAAARALASAR